MQHRNAKHPHFHLRWILLLFLPTLVVAQHGNQQAVSALGRLEPEGGIIRLAAPSTPQAISGSILAELHVNEGDYVKQGDLLAITDSMQLMQVALHQVETELALSILASEAEQSRADEACVLASVAAREAERRTNLLARKLASEEETEQAQGIAEARSAACTAAQANSRVAEARIDVARTRVAFKKTELQRTFISAPFDSRVLDILVQPGEFIGLTGILELGRVERMYAIAEVYETDIRRVAIGQKARISSDALAEPLTGHVEFIHLKVAKQDEIGTDPAARKDARIIEVEILLDQPELAADLTHLQVDIVIGD
ncbi:MAG: efflux RND transporter periplasmic adaptor subunit [Xanthomonadales bacterium]